MADLHHHGNRFPRLTTLWLGVSFFVLTGTGGAFAASIPTNVVHASPDEMIEFKDFLEGGPRHWATVSDMKVPAGVTVRHTDGQLKNNLVAEYVSWMHDRHPKHFDLRHPALGALIEQAEAVKATKTTAIHAASAATSTTTAASSSGATSGSVARAQTLSVPSVAAEEMIGPPVFVPEPSSALALLLLFGGAGAWRRFRPR